MEAQSPGRRARARAVGWLIAGGAAMVLVWVALPHDAGVRDAPVIGLVVATWLLAALLLGGRFDRASRFASIGVLIAAAALITLTLIAIGQPTSGFALFYVCLCPYAFATGPVRHAIVLVGAVA